MLASTAMMAALYGYVYNTKRQLYLLVWAAAWILFALHFAGFVLYPQVDQAPWQSAIEMWLVAAAALLFFLSAQLYKQTPPWLYTIGGAAAILALWSVSYAQGQIGISPGFGIAVVFFAAAVSFWRANGKQETLADTGLGMAFGLWGVLGIANEFASQFSPNVRPLLSTLTVLPLTLAGVLMAVALYEEEKRRIERHMLALSNLNLATASMTGSEVQRMLAQALDRILNVVHIPSGALFLHHGNPQGPTSRRRCRTERHFLHRCAARRT